MYVPNDSNSYIVEDKAEKVCRETDKKPNQHLIVDLVKVLICVDTGASGMCIVEQILIKMRIIIGQVTTES